MTGEHESDHETVDDIDPAAGTTDGADPIDESPEDLQPDPIDELPEDLQPDPIDELPEDLQPDPIDELPEDLQRDPIDELPEDLQPDLVDHDDYIFPNNNRRRIPGYLYLGIAAALVVVYLLRGDGVFVNVGYLAVAALLSLFGLYSLVAGWNLDVDERDALVAAIGEIGFPVGHASAQMGWRGWLSRPVWRLLLYSADEPPSKRGFVLVDGVDGRVIESFVEANPEDWSDFADQSSAT